MPACCTDVGERAVIGRLLAAARGRGWRPGGARRARDRQVGAVGRRCPTGCGHARAPRGGGGGRIGACLRHPARAAASCARWGGAATRPPRRALRVAFGIQAEEAPDRFLVSLAALTLLSDSAGSACCAWSTTRTGRTRRRWRRSASSPGGWPPSRSRCSSPSGMARAGGRHGRPGRAALDPPGARRGGGAAGRASRRPPGPGGAPPALAVSGGNPLALVDFPPRSPASSAPAVTRWTTRCHWPASWSAPSCGASVDATPRRRRCCCWRPPRRRPARHRPPRRRTARPGPGPAGVGGAGRPGACRADDAQLRIP